MSKQTLTIGLLMLMFTVTSCGQKEAVRRPKPHPVHEQPVPPSADKPTTQSDHDSAPTPSAPKPAPTPAPISDDTAPEIPETPEAEITPPTVVDDEPQPAPLAPVEDFKDGEWLFEAISAQRLSIAILDTASIQRVAESRYELAFHAGQVDTVSDIAAKMVKSGGAYCAIIITDKYNPANLPNGIVISALTIKEQTVENGFRSLLITFPTHEIGISCLKMNARSFKLKEVREALAGAISLKIAH